MASPKEPLPKSIIDNIFKNETKIAGIIILLLFCFIIPYLTWKLTKKKKDIQKPINNESYSLISIYICNMAILSLIS